MQFERNKMAKAMISVFLVLTIAVTLVVLPTASAHDPPWNIVTYAYLTAAPDPVGVNQQVTLVFWLDKYPPTAGGTTGDRWRNEMIYVTKPDGSQETLGPYVSDPVGSNWAQYTPTQVGTYTFNFSFPGQVLGLAGPTGLVGLDSVFINDTYLESSATATVTVQEEEIAPVPTFPLPTSYWTRPIEGQNTNWYTISSNWMGSPQIVGKFQPDGTAPNSAHVMWTKPLSFGGVIGGTNTGANGTTVYDGSQYENKFTNPLIMYGRLYYSVPLADRPTGGGYACVDLRTGEEIWLQNYGILDPLTGHFFDVAGDPSRGQFLDYESLNQHGIVPNGYLWSVPGRGQPADTPWQAYDPFTGEWLFNETGIPSGTEVYGPNGEILRYVLDSNGWLGLWSNAAHGVGLEAANDNSTSGWQWRPVGKEVNMSTAYLWNVTVPWLPGDATIVSVIYDDVLLGRNGSLPGISRTGASVTEPYTMWAISLKPASRGTLLWMKNYDPPAGNLTRSQGPVDPVNRVFTMWDKETIQWSGYSLDDGSLLWTTPSENPWNIYSGAGGALMTNTIAYGKLYSTGYSGIVYCYDTKTGELLWNYTVPGGLETPYPGYPLGIAGVADGKLYLNTNEHSSGAPYWKGCKLRCLNATTGDEIWTIYTHGASSYGTYGYAIADGYLVFLNVYDMQVYCIGKGPSATTVDAPMTAVTQGSTVVIRGMVTDVSAGAKSKVQDGEFNVVPAVSDASMGQWMEYVYMQKPMPTNATGVEVSLDAVDPNGNFVHIGTATSDYSGLYSYSWTPDIPGEYTIIATFAGTKSYWGSYAETATFVSETPTATTPATETTIQESPMLTYLLAAAIVIIILAVVAIVLLLRRK